MAQMILITHPESVPKECREDIVIACDAIGRIYSKCYRRRVEPDGSIATPKHGRRVPSGHYTQKCDENGDLMTVEEFKASVAAGAFIDYDGFGCAVKDGMENSEFIYPSQVHRIPVDATHICWYNR